MQVQLKQAEIITALKQYISGQGISIFGKDVSISFTAGRKEAGISADITIEDPAIPGFTDALQDTANTLLAIVKPTDAAPVITPEVAVVDTPVAAEEAVASSAKTTSLFS